MTQQVNNANIDLASVGDEVTFYSGPGTSTETNIYLNLDHTPSKIHVANDKVCVIVAINGINFTNPRTVSAGTGFGFTATSNAGSFVPISSIKIRAAATTSHFEVMMW